MLLSSSAVSAVGLSGANRQPWTVHASHSTSLDLIAAMDSFPLPASLSFWVASFGSELPLKFLRINSVRSSWVHAFPAEDGCCIFRICLGDFGEELYHRIDCLGQVEGLFLILIEIREFLLFLVVFLLRRFLLCFLCCCYCRLLDILLRFSRRLAFRAVFNLFLLCCR